jgi:Na+-exporting ATPase
MTRPPHSLKIGVFSRELIIDKMVYGTFMGNLCLAAFATVAYGVGDGALGTNCNESYNESCYVVFRARATTNATISFLLLVKAWEVKHFTRSIFNLDPARYPGPFSIFPTLWRNGFLFWAMTAGFLIIFPVFSIPLVNERIFKHKSTGWEWGVSFACLTIYIGLIRVRKPLSKDAGSATGIR